MSNNKELGKEIIEEAESINLIEDLATPSDNNSRFEDLLEVHKKDDLVHIIHPCWFKVSGNVSMATTVDLSWISPLPLNIEEVYGYIRTAPVGAALLVDINKNGTSIFQTRLTIADGANTGSQKAIRIPGQPHLNINDRLDIDVDQVGSSTAGANLSVFIRFKLV